MSPYPISSTNMTMMLGAKVVFVGFQAGVASALVDLDVNFGVIPTVVSMEDGFELLQSMTSIVSFADQTEEIETAILDAVLMEDEWADGEIVFEGVPLEKGWNHMLLTVAQITQDWKTKFSFTSSKPEFLKELKTTVDR